MVGAVLVPARPLPRLHLVILGRVTPDAQQRARYLDSGNWLPLGRVTPLSRVTPLGRVTSLSLKNQDSHMMREEDECGWRSVFRSKKVKESL